MQKPTQFFVCSKEKFQSVDWIQLLGLKIYSDLKFVKIIIRFVKNSNFYLQMEKMDRFL